MRIYLVQHAKAVAKDVDPQRPLSEQGLQEAKRIASFLGQAGTPVAGILHSGKTRAEQTARILADVLFPGGEVQVHSGLNPKDPAEPFKNWINEQPTNTLVVGHLPFLGRVTSLLVTGDAAHATVAYQPGSVLCLERDENGHWSVAWMIRPELLDPNSA